ncbi:MAG: hypothetical protein EOP39_18315 [Rubrivivax sp.]|nr:MAG: hypothetical protein EOP39_18315 [Rubrivivax sp.]
MAIIAPIPYSRLHDAERIQFLKDFLAGLEAGGTLPDPVPVLRDQLSASVDDLELLYRRAQESQQTARLEERDDRRDHIVQGIAGACTAFLHHCRPAHAAAAQALLASFNPYGGARAVTLQNYVAQTTSVRNLLDDWRSKPLFADALRTLDFQDWADELNTVNGEVESLYRERARQEGMEELPFTMRQKRAEAKERYDELREVVNGGYRMTRGQAPWLHVVAALSRLTEQYGQQVAVREGRAGAAAAAPAPSV